MIDGLILKNPELEMLTNNKSDGIAYRERRHSEWTENYELYRDKVTYNRFTQRQSVNLPIMKQFIQTLLTNVDDFPVLFFQNLDNNKDAEIFKNEYWKWTVDYNHMEINDIVDKKQVFMFGRTFDQWQIVNGRIKQTIIDPMDIIVSRYTDPTNLHSSRYLNHMHIFVPLSALEANEGYDRDAILQLKKFYASEMGLVKVVENADSFADKNKKMEDMGMTDLASPLLGETYVELDIQIIRRDGDKYEGRSIDDENVMYVTAEDQCILMKKPLENVIGTTKDNFWRTHFPYESWADDVDRQDFWTSAKADMIRTPNKILNSMFAQEVENRTLKNFNMKYFDAVKAADANWTPPTNQDLVAGGWYPLPGKPSEVFMLNPVADLGQNQPFMEFLVNLMQNATGAVPSLQGSSEQKQITLGQFEGIMGEAKDRVKGMSKFYTPAWHNRGMLFEKLIEAAPDQLEAVQIYKKGRNTDKIYTREVSYKDWQTPLGYVVKVWSQEEKNSMDAKALEKMNILTQRMPENAKVKEIMDRKAAEWAGLTPEEINAIMDEEKQRQEMLATMAQTQGGLNTQVTPPQPSIQPPQLPMATA